MASRAGVGKRWYGLPYGRTYGRAFDHWAGTSSEAGPWYAGRYPWRRPPTCRRWCCAPAGQLGLCDNHYRQYLADRFKPGERVATRVDSNQIFARSSI